MIGGKRAISCQGLPGSCCCRVKQSLGVVCIPCFPTSGSCGNCITTADPVLSPSWERATTACPPCAPSPPKKKSQINARIFWVSWESVAADAVVGWWVWRTHEVARWLRTDGERCPRDRPRRQSANPESRSQRDETRKVRALAPTCIILRTVELPACFLLSSISLLAARHAILTNPSRELDLDQTEKKKSPNFTRARTLQAVQALSLLGTHISRIRNPAASGIGSARQALHSFWWFGAKAVSIPSFLPRCVVRNSDGAMATMRTLLAQHGIIGAHAAAAAAASPRPVAESRRHTGSSRAGCTRTTRFCPPDSAAPSARTFAPIAARPSISVLFLSTRRFHVQNIRLFFPTFLTSPTRP